MGYIYILFSQLLLNCREKERSIVVQMIEYNCMTYISLASTLVNIYVYNRLLKIFIIEKARRSDTRREGRVRGRELRETRSRFYEKKIHILIISLKIRGTNTQQSRNQYLSRQDGKPHVSVHYSP